MEDRVALTPGKRVDIANRLLNLSKGAENTSNDGVIAEDKSVDDRSNVSLSTPMSKPLSETHTATTVMAKRGFASFESIDAAKRAIPQRDKNLPNHTKNNLLRYKPIVI